MIRDHFNELRAEVERSTDLPEETRAKLLQLADQLEREVISSGAADREADADEDEDDESRDESGETPDGGSSGLVSAIEGFEASHPELSNAVNNVAAMLSKLGF